MRIATSVFGILFTAAMLPTYAQRDGPSRQDERQQGRQEKNAPQRPQHAQRPQPQQSVQQQERQPQQQRAQQPQRVQQQARPRPAPVRQQVQPQRTQQQARSWQQQRGWVQSGGWQGRDNWQQARAEHWASDHRTWAQRGGYGGYYVPQASFNLYFGSQHSFRIRSRPVMYLGYPRFEYGGYSFLLVDPYPEYWSDNWYASDDVYIDYDDGYYLYDRKHPQVRLAVTIAL